MANLETKFETLEAQLATQHEAIGNALDALLSALGVPPPTATVTLGDIAELMTAINNNLIGIAIANGSFHSAMLDLLGLINVNTDTIITNNSLNAQRTIAAIYETFCACATDTPLLAPPMDVTPTTLVDQAKCRRIQFYLSVFGQWLNKIANYGASGAAITGGTIATLLAVVAADAGIVATGAEVGAVGGPPGMIIGAVVGLIAVAAYTFGGSILIDYAAQFNDPTMQDNLLQALYAADNAESGYGAFKTVILANMDAIPAEIIYTLWWSAWSNDIYSGVPTVDDSAFDGTICIPLFHEITTCTTYYSSVYTNTEGTHYHAILSAPVYGPNDAFVAGNFDGWTVRLLTDPGVDLRCDFYTVGGVYNAGTLLGAVGDMHTWPATAAIGMRTGGGTGVPYSVEICPPV
jgi:hypothetical protein